MHVFSLCGAKGLLAGTDQLLKQLSPAPAPGPAGVFGRAGKGTA